MEDGPITHWYRHDSLDNVKIFIVIPIAQDHGANVLVVSDILRAMNNQSWLRFRPDSFIIKDFCGILTSEEPTSVLSGIM